MLGSFQHSRAFHRLTCAPAESRTIGICAVLFFDKFAGDQILLNAISTNIDDFAVFNLNHARTSFLDNFVAVRRNDEQL